MKTYRCPYCGFTDFEFQDIHEQDVQGKGDNQSVGGHEQATLPVKVQVKCCACHWVGTVEQLAGHHEKMASE